jgi:hypothetical protein
MINTGDIKNHHTNWLYKKQKIYCKIYHMSTQYVVQVQTEEKHYVLCFEINRKDLEERVPVFPGKRGRRGGGEKSQCIRGFAAHQRIKAT